MPEMRKDPIREQWVIIATDRALKPLEFPINKNGVMVEGSKSACPFCEGNESLTTPEISSYRNESSHPNGPGWTIRTVPNKFSPFRLQGDFHLDQSGIYTSHNGLGQHEVVIETPEHGLQFHQFPAGQLELVYLMQRERYQALASDERVKYIQIYKNRGFFAGASLEHSHSQVLALPMLPLLHRGIGEYFYRLGHCLLCNILEQEQKEKKRIICETPSFVIFCPYASRFSYEVWIVPRNHQEHFGEITNEQITELAGIVEVVLPSMMECLNDPSYNIITNSSPVNLPGVKGYHWFIEINPRLMVQNGMELSCGYFINPVAPEVAADILREKTAGLINGLAGYNE